MSPFHLSLFQISLVRFVSLFAKLRLIYPISKKQRIENKLWNLGA
jgi:hypothetical protein